ncbi:MAG: hypothetical protein QOE05_3216 [Actinomycetota bacterium]|jgi:hypothetical protein|nr:hypothetical protein [Actinomycetota bacterium]
MLRTAGRLVAVTAATVASAAALQGTALAGPGETFGLSWGTVGACYERSVTVSVSSPDPAEYIQFQLSVTVGTTTKRGAITTVTPQNGGPVGPVTVSVKDCSAATGQAAVYDIWVNGYKNALAAPDYVFDQAHGYSVCDTPAAAGCTETPVAAPVITRTPVA